MPRYSRRGVPWCTSYGYGNISHHPRVLIIFPVPCFFHCWGALLKSPGLVQDRQVSSSTFAKAHVDLVQVAVGHWWMRGEVYDC